MCAYVCEVRERSSNAFELEGSFSGMLNKFRQAPVCVCACVCVAKYTARAK